MSNVTTWYASSMQDLVGIVFDGYATYDPPGWFRGPDNGGFRVYETWVQTDSDVVLSLSSGGDDGHSVFIDREFVGGAGFGVSLFPDLILQAGVPCRLTLTSNNAIGGWHVNCKARIGDDGDRVPLEAIPGIAIHADGDFSSHARSDLVLHYSFDREDRDGNVIWDRSRHGNDGIVTGPVYAEEGIDGAFCVLDGEDDRIAVANSESLELREQVTVAVWVKLRSFGPGGYGNEHGYIVDKGNDLWWNPAFCLGYTKKSGSSLPRWPAKPGPFPALFHVGNETDPQRGGGKKVYSETLLATNVWYHLAGTYDGSTVSIYVNGELENSAPYSGLIRSDHAPVHVGGGKLFSTAWGNQFTVDGAVDDVRIYDRALSADEVAALVGVERERASLMVAGEPGAYGEPTPHGYGPESYVQGRAVECSVAAVVSLGERSRARCRGWTGEGSVPGRGSSNVCRFVISEPSVLTWQWAVEHRLELEVDGRGILDVAGGWLAEGGDVLVHAFAYPGWMFQEWTGDAGELGARRRAAKVALDGPKSLTAVFCIDSDGDGLPDWWELEHFRSLERCRCMDTDRDGLTNAEEWARGTNPVCRDTDNDGALDGAEVRMGSDPLVADSGPRRRRRRPLITWESQRDQCYCVERSTNLADGFMRIATNVPATPPMNEFMDTTATGGGPRFYRIVEEEVSPSGKAGAAIAPASADSPQQPTRRTRDMGVRLRVVEGVE